LWEIENRKSVRKEKQLHVSEKTRAFERRAKNQEGRARKREIHPFYCRIC